MAKKLLITLITMLLGVSSTIAQSPLNNAADNIVGTYSGLQNGDKFRAKIVKLTNGTYRGQIVWVEHDKDARGNKILDAKNPDKKLRQTPCDQIVLFSGLKYDAKEREWNGAKIYDPQRGLRAKLTVRFEKDGRLRLKGSLFGISENIYWTKENN
ncbi:MAG: DUF2147 domain-containing protein [Bacteroidales bacterium]|nr:DUF2147 domain-containing protein [Bacteroidales bacterium]